MFIEYTEEDTKALNNYISKLEKKLKELKAIKKQIAYQGKVPNQGEILIPASRLITEAFLQ